MVHDYLNSLFCNNLKFLIQDQRKNLPSKEDRRQLFHDGFEKINSNYHPYNLEFLFIYGLNRLFSYLTSVICEEIGR